MDLTANQSPEYDPDALLALVGAIIGQALRDAHNRRREIAVDAARWLVWDAPVLLVLAGAEMDPDAAQRQLVDLIRQPNGPGRRKVAKND